MTPVELPSVTVLNKVAPIGFKPSASAHSGQKSGSDGLQPVKTVSGQSVCSHLSTAVVSPVDDADEELDLLLGLQNPVTSLSLAKSKNSNTVEVSAASERGEC